MNARTGTAISVVAVLIIGSVDWVVADWFGLPKTVTPLEKDIDSLPLQLGDWRGEPTERDPVLDEAVGADSIVNRVYTDAAGTAIAAHIAVFSEYSGLSHNPRECHQGAGYFIRTERDLSIQTTGLEPVHCCVLQLTRSMEQRSVLFWYQLDDTMIRNADDLKVAHRQLRGNSARPPLIKVMLSCNGQGEQVNNRLADLSGEIVAWLNR